jgi:hypothetical protein
MKRRDDTTEYRERLPRRNVRWREIAEINEVGWRLAFGVLGHDDTPQSNNSGSAAASCRLPSSFIFPSVKAR